MSGLLKSCMLGRKVIYVWKLFPDASPVVNCFISPLILADNYASYYVNIMCIQNHLVNFRIGTAYILKRKRNATLSKMVVSSFS